MNGAQTGYALFDGRGTLEDANSQFFVANDNRICDMRGMDSASVVAEVLSNLKSFDGRMVEMTDAFIKDAAARWSRPDKIPVEAQTADGGWRLLTAHPRPNGGIALMSVDITEMKNAELAHLENIDIFRCITDSHPLPVWVVDQESKEILYESLDASNLLGRKWQPHQQYITDHYVKSNEFEQLRSLASKYHIVRDYEMQLKRTNGSTIWCSANCRRGVYRGGPRLLLAYWTLRSANSARIFSDS